MNKTPFLMLTALALLGLPSLAEQTASKPPVKTPLSWTLNSVSYPYDPLLLASTPQTPFVTLKAQSMVLPEILAEIKKQSGQEVKWGGPESKLPKLSLTTRQAPFLAAIAQLCKQTKTGFVAYSQPGHPIEVNYPDAKSAVSVKPVLAWQAQGPLLLIWNGKVTDTSFDFKQKPPRSYKSTFLSLALTMDQQSSASLEVPAATMLHFTLSNGKPVSVTPEELQDGAGGRVWRITDKALAGKANVSLELPLKVSMPTRVFSGFLSWKPKTLQAVENQTLVLSEISKTETGLQITLKARPGLPKGMTEAQVQQLLAKELAHTTTAAEHKLLETVVKPAQAMDLDAKNLYLEDNKGARLLGSIRESIGGPGLGYEFKLVFDTKESFKPRRMYLSWKGANQTVDVKFKLKGLNIPF